MQSIAAINIVAAVLTRGFVQHASPSAAPHLDSTVLANFLLGAVAIVCFKEQRQSRIFLFGLAFSTAAMAFLGLLQGTWGLAIVVGLWSVQSFNRWWKESGMNRFKMRLSKRTNQWNSESRISRLFGTEEPDSEHRVKYRE